MQHNTTSNLLEALHEIIKAITINLLLLLQAFVLLVLVNSLHQNATNCFITNVKRVVMANAIKLTRVFNHYNCDMAAVTLHT